MPYNYLIDPKIRENYAIYYESSIIIFDEAHNVEKVSEDVTSFELDSTMMFAASNEIKSLMAAISNDESLND